MQAGRRSAEWNQVAAHATTRARQQGPARPVCYSLEPAMTSRLAAASFDPSRRKLFGSAAALAAGSALLGEFVSAADNPAANVEDRGADLKISALRGFRVGTKVFLKI